MIRILFDKGIFVILLFIFIMFCRGSEKIDERKIKEMSPEEVLQILKSPAYKDPSFEYLELHNLLHISQSLMLDSNYTLLDSITPFILTKWEKLLVAEGEYAIKNKEYRLSLISLDEFIQRFISAIRNDENDQLWTIYQGLSRAFLSAEFYAEKARKGDN